MHRPRYDDWTLPKGHVDPGEHSTVAALREIDEETGHSARLVQYVTLASYDVARRKRHGKPAPGVDAKTVRKRVHYWSALATGGSFASGEEVDELRWMPAAAAPERLTYSLDRKVMRTFMRLPRSSCTMLLVRHAKAGRKQGYVGDDRLRPLDEKGRAQAEALVGVLGSFAPGSIASAPLVRCEQTVTPLAEDLGLSIAAEPALCESAYADDPRKAHKRIRRIARAAAESGTVPVVCSQGGVIPGLMRWWSEADGVDLGPAQHRKASVWVLSLDGDRLLAAHHIASPLPLV